MPRVPRFYLSVLLTKELETTTQLEGTQMYEAR